MNEKKLLSIVNKVHENKYDGLLLSNFNNIGYISNYFPTAFAFLLLKEDPVVYTSPLDFELAEKSSNIEVKKIKSFRELKEIFKKEKYKRLAIEKTLSIETYQKLSGKWELIVDDLIEKERMIKTSEELSNIKKATEIAHKSYKELDLNKKSSEWEIAYQLGYIMRENGAESESFETIVASGANSSLPHSTPGKREITHPILIDWGAKYNNYCSDSTRTKIYSEKEEEIANIVLEAYNKTIKAIKPGVKTSHLDKIARDVIAEYGYEKEFIHSTGHSLGLDVHEKPNLSKKDHTVLEKDMVITVEPGIYLKGEFGVRIEDTIHVTNKGEVIGNLKPII